MKKRFRLLCVLLRILASFSEIVGVRSQRNPKQVLDEIFCLSAKREIESTYSPPMRISHIEAIFHHPDRAYLVEKPTSKNLSVSLSMGYKKDIFAVFAYDFELLQK